MSCFTVLGKGIFSSSSTCADQLTFSLLLLIRVTFNKTPPKRLFAPFVPALRIYQAQNLTDLVSKLAAVMQTLLLHFPK